MSYDQFQNDFRQLISIDNSTKEIPPWITERLLNPRNNISACWSILDNACWQFYAAMAIAKQNIPAFFIVDISGTDANELLVETLLWLFRGVNTTPNHGCIQGSSLQARVRIATSAGMSDWSDTFPVKKSGFPWLIVVAASSGAFIIAAITGSLGWLYYHKRKIEPLKDIQETLYGLEHRSYLHRQSIREPPKIDLARTLPVLPTIDKDNELYDVTPYEPSPLQSPTPRSVVNFDAIMADYYQPANGGMQSIQYVDAELRT
uniref:Uncharacterized protein n=1 Tax=Plectus sambesii TaxID=2011161 RepID=A0A914WDS6_9BILA